MFNSHITLKQQLSAPSLDMRRAATPPAVQTPLLPTTSLAGLLAQFSAYGAATGSKRTCKGESRGSALLSANNNDNKATNQLSQLLMSQTSAPSDNSVQCALCNAWLNREHTALYAHVRTHLQVKSLKTPLQKHTWTYPYLFRPTNYISTAVTVQTVRCYPRCRTRINATYCSSPAFRTCHCSRYCDSVCEATMKLSVNTLNSTTVILSEKNVHYNVEKSTPTRPLPSVCCLFADLNVDFLSCGSIVTTFACHHW